VDQMKSRRQNAEGMQSDGSWLLRPKVWFLATCLFGVLSLVASLSVAIDPFSRALDVITALALFVVGLHAFLGGSGAVSRHLAACEEGCHRP
jgi:hypothetical protein